MIMEAMRDIVMWAIPEECRAAVECYTTEGAAFMQRHWAGLTGVFVEHSDVNDFLEKAREEGCSCTLKLKVA